ncbi:phage tail protein [Pseudomonas sp. CCI4.2]|uniref:phage tail-collar fiber domain-containing protein n=1 Tax=Pseudomonas sp. CCI4.2 TaxID=3048620 RepID=UPI002AC92C37|nr:phage tail protein [Pseudomonas sp. CCI4.2]MEB0090079.1 phage tail protein [Pseudomonas sp. CCI4.2]WPX53457.1 phage tail protein [Pseudomonas sp. CCI4.2]
MGAAITKAGERLIAQKQADGETLNVVRFVIALVPDLDPDAPVDRDGLKPIPEQIMYSQAITQRGFVNPNQVIYSLMLGSDIGDFDWNWIGLETEEDVLLSVAYVPLQQKRKNIPPHQIGNNVTRNFLVVFDGAQALTAITVDASTWQHDFTVRLNSIDERERLHNRDLYGRVCFFADGFRLEKTDGEEDEPSVFHLLPGVGYVEGIRLASSLAEPVEPPPSSVGYAWLDVTLGRELNDRVARWTLIYSQDKFDDYVDADGIAHFCVEIAMVQGDIAPQDTRTYEPFESAVIRHYAARKGDYPELRARGTTKDDVGLDQIPNAISDDPETNSSEIVASTAALNRLNQQISDSLVGMVAAFDTVSAPTGWLKRNGADVSRTAYAKLFEVIGTRYGAGDGDTTFNVGDSRGRFIRGLDDGRGLDPDRALGSEQEGQNLVHDHGAVSSEAGWHGHGGSVGGGGSHGHEVSGATHNAGNHVHNLQTYGPWAGAQGASSFNGQGVGPVTVTEAAGEHAHTLVGTAHAIGDHGHGLDIQPEGNHAHGITVHASGGSENRPGNVAFLICVKY